MSSERVRFRDKSTGRTGSVPVSEVGKLPDSFELIGAADGVDTRQKQAQELLGKQKKSADEGNQRLADVGTRALDAMGMGATQRTSAALATNPASLAMGVPLAMLDAALYVPDMMLGTDMAGKAREALTSWGEMNPHADTGIPVTYAEGSAERDMHKVLESNVDTARERTEFGPAVPEDVPIVGGMSAGGLALDLAAGAPLGFATGAATRVANAGAGAGGALKSFGKEMVQAGKEAFPYGVAMGWDEPTEDPEWEMAERSMNALGSGAAASLFGSGVQALGKVLGSPATGIVRWLRGSGKKLGEQTLGGEIRQLEYSREVAGDTPSATAMYKPGAINPPSNVRSALEAELKGESASPGEFLKGRLMSEFPEQMTMVQSAKDKANQGLDIASSAAQSEAQAIQRQGKMAFESFVDKAAEKLDTTISTSKKRMDAETQSYFDSSSEALDKKISASPLYNKLKSSWMAGLSEGTPDPYTAAPDFEKEMNKSLVTEIFVDDGGKRSEKMFALHGEDNVTLLPYERAVSRGLIREDGEIARGIKDGAIKSEDVRVAVRPKEMTAQSLDTVIRSLNKAVNAANNRGGANSELLGLRATAMEMRRQFPELEALKKRHEVESEQLASGMRALGVEGFKDLTQLPPRASIRSNIRNAMLEPVETAERQGVMAALRKAGMGSEVAQMEAEQLARADLASLTKEGETIGNKLGARAKLRKQMATSDPVAMELSGMLGNQGGVDVLYTRPGGVGAGDMMRESMQEVSQLRSLASELGMDPGGILERPDEQIASDMMDAVWEYANSDNRTETLNKQFGSDSDFIKRVKEVVPGLRAYLAIHTGGPSTHMTTSGGTPHFWNSIGGHQALIALDPYARMVAGVDPSVRLSGKGEAGLFDAPASPAAVQEQIDAAVEWLKAFDEKMMLEARRGAEKLRKQGSEK